MNAAAIHAKQLDELTEQVSDLLDPLAKTADPRLLTIAVADVLAVMMGAGLATGVMVPERDIKALFERLAREIRWATDVASRDIQAGGH